MNTPEIYLDPVQAAYLLRCHQAEIPSSIPFTSFGPEPPYRQFYSLQAVLAHTGGQLVDEMTFARITGRTREDLLADVRAGVGYTAVNSDGLGWFYNLADL